MQILDGWQSLVGNTDKPTDGLQINSPSTYLKIEYCMRLLSAFSHRWFIICTTFEKMFQKLFHKSNWTLFIILSLCLKSVTFYLKDVQFDVKMRYLWSMQKVPSGYYATLCDNVRNRKKTSRYIKGAIKKTKRMTKITNLSNFNM